MAAPGAIAFASGMARAVTRATLATQPLVPTGSRLIDKWTP